MQGKTPSGELRETLGMGREAGAVGHLVDQRREPPGGDCLAVEQADRARGDVARIGVQRLAGRLALAIQALELGARHKDLAAHQQPARCALRQPQRQGTHRAQVRGDIVTHRTVAARRATHQDPVLVEQRERHAVDLELGDEGEPRGRFDRRQPLEPRPPLAQLFQIVGIFERHHRRLVAHLGEAGDRFSAHAPSRTVGGRELRRRSLERHELGHQPVELAIRDLRPALAVVQPLVTLDLAAQEGGAPRRSTRGGGVHGRPPSRSAWRRGGRGRCRARAG